MSEKNNIVHSGVPGQRWGIRKYQNKDGSLTDLGRKHYGYGESRSAGSDYKRKGFLFKKKPQPPKPTTEQQQMLDANKKLLEEAMKRSTDGLDMKRQGMSQAAQEYINKKKQQAAESGDESTTKILENTEARANGQQHPNQNQNPNKNNQQNQNSQKNIDNMNADELRAYIKKQSERKNSHELMAKNVSELRDSDVQNLMNRLNSEMSLNNTIRKYNESQKSPEQKAYEAKVEKGKRNAEKFIKIAGEVAIDMIMKQIEKKVDGNKDAEVGMKFAKSVWNQYKNQREK